MTTVTTLDLLPFQEFRRGPFDSGEVGSMALISNLVYIPGMYILGSRLVGPY